MTKTMDRIQKEEFKEEFKKRVKDQAKMLYRKTLDEVSDRHKFVCVAYAVKDIVIDSGLLHRRLMMRLMAEQFIIYQWSS